jgi:protein gp37
LKWDREAAKLGERHRVFSGSMCDVFEDRPDLVEPRARLFELIGKTPNLDWLLCTKRVENVGNMVPRSWWPFPENVWMLFTAENQEMYDKRVEWASLWPCKTIGVSIEPMLGPVVFERFQFKPDWAIYGCESGAKRRPCPGMWILNGIVQCRDKGIKCFVKQVEVNGKVNKELSEWPPALQVQEFPG